MAHLNMKVLGPGVRLTILGLPLDENDRLAIEYRNEKRTSAVITSCTIDNLVISVSGTQWKRFRVKLKPADESVSLSETDDWAITVWEVRFQGSKGG